ncbi:MAG: hypothetical protein KAU47_06945 [Candidatus Aminicenantes bacterium]|jgi:hypothetical protein|nr:hypothetical protein [Candidatus Aminicenantes bacterium]
MIKKEKIAEKIVEELSLFVFLKEKEIEFLENMIKNGMEFLPQVDREYTIKLLSEIIGAKKKELEKYQAFPQTDTH